MGMAVTTTRFPLTWPPYKPRTPAHHRETSDFGFRRQHSNLTPERAQRELMEEIDRLGGRQIVLSTNIQLRNDGMPYANQRPATDDPGVAVYFTRRGKDMCFACDKWATVHENIWAIRKSIEALRGLERWGSKDMMEAAFTGFAALPAPEQPFQVLGVSANASKDDIERAYRRLAATHHPDRAGDDGQAMARINRARDAMLGAP